MSFTRTSASQVKAFKQCARFWYYGWVDKIKQPQTLAQARGTGIHDGNENYLKTGEIRDGDFSNYVKAAAQHLPKPRSPGLLIEARIDLECGPGLPSWLGYLDVFDPNQNPALLLDHKSTSDFRYAKTPKELQEDTQLMSYGKWIYDHGHVRKDEHLKVGHLYLKTSPAPPKKPPPTLLVTAKVDREMVETIWARDMVTVAEMVNASKAKSAQDLPPTVSSCGMYGGCPHRTRCGFLNSEGMNFFQQRKQTAQQGVTTMSSFLERLNKGKGNGTSTAAVPTTRSAKLPTGVVPPDAPSRETPVEAPVEAVAETMTQAEKPKRGRPRKEREVSKDFIIYVDCMPTKNTTGDLEPTLFEDWINPVLMALNETVLQEKNLPHYQLMNFGEEKACLALAVQERIENLPQTLLVNSSNMVARDVLPLLIPHATQVVRALRG